MRRTGKALLKALSDFLTGQMAAPHLLSNLAAEQTR
jgi:hypothetical protein